MELNRTPNELDRNARNKENDNWDIIEGEIKTIGGKVDDFIQEVSDEALDKIVDNAKLNWKEPVDSFGDLPSNAQKGDARMDKSTGKVYRYNGSKWVEIQQIDAGPVNELDSRLNSQLAQTNKKSNKETHSIRSNKAKIGIIDDDGRNDIMDTWLPLLKSHNFKLDIGIITGLVGSSGFLDWEELNDLYGSYKVDIINHSHTHENLNELTEKVLREELENSLRVI